MQQLAYAPHRPMVAVQHVYIGHGRALRPGDPVPELLENHRMVLFRQGRIAMRDDPWAELMLLRAGIALEPILGVAPWDKVGP